MVSKVSVCLKEIPFSSFDNEMTKELLLPVNTFEAGH
jgi:hypothetical protein